MPTTLTTNAVEESTYVVTVSFTDETGATVVPNSVNWSLTTDKGTVVNSRSAVSVTAATSITVVLSGDDLKIVERENLARLFTIVADYDSSNGSSLPLNDEVVFFITPLKVVRQ